MPGIPALVAQGVAEKFGLADSTNEIRKTFRHSFSYAFESSQRTKDLFPNELEEAMQDLRNSVRDLASSTDRLGHKELKILPTEGKYVIFSDHHLLYRNHRQNFFGERNIALYDKVLRKYLKAGYTLVENGDMEDLVVPDPAHEQQMLDEFDARKALLKKCVKDGEIRDRDALDSLVARRRPFRLRQYKRILADASVGTGNENLYATIAGFIQAGKYVKIAGNHDYDIQKPEFLAILNDHLRQVTRPSNAPAPRLEKVYDYLLLTSGKKARKVDFAIMHGHQFDKVSNPRAAHVAGEVYSEGAAWGFQGADRNWKATDTNELPNRLKGWAEGNYEFRNNLVATDERQSLLGTDGEMFEAISGHTIAWDYFKHKPGLESFVNEVMTGKQFFKYRHLDELNLVRLMAKYFPNDEKTPVLVFGHSHEVRLNAGYLARTAHAPVAGPIEYDLSKSEWRAYPYYCNSGSAGRFENLIWGIEIDDGVPRVISWELDQAGQARRHLHHSREARSFDGRALVAETQSSEIP